MVNILRAIADLKKHTCVRFVKHKNETDYVEMHAGKGCSSNVGRIGGQQMISLKLGHCATRKGVVVHEMVSCQLLLRIY